MTHGNTKNQNAKKANPRTCTISVRISPELKQRLVSCSETGDHNKQARLELEALYGLN